MVDNIFFFVKHVATSYLSIKATALLSVTV